MEKALCQKCQSAQPSDFAGNRGHQAAGSASQWGRDAEDFAHQGLLGGKSASQKYPLPALCLQRPSSTD